MKNSCPECGADMVLRMSQYGYFYGCVEYPNCDGTHSCDKEGNPLGTPANAETKQWRVKAHHEFDKLWKGPNKIMTRTKAYSYLAKAMNLPPQKAHIAHFNIQQCKVLINLLKPTK